MLELNEALDALEAADPRAAKLVKLRFFVGLTRKEAAQVLGVSVATADSDLASDILRHLNDEPVEACPPSTIYQLRKLTRKNKTAIVTTGLVAISLIVGMSVSIWQASEANSARELADRRSIDAERQSISAVRAAKQAQQSDEYSRQLVYAADVRLAAQAWKSGDISRFTDQLNRHTPQAGEADRRGFEWRYLQQFGTASFTTIASNTGGGGVSCLLRMLFSRRKTCSRRHQSKSNPSLRRPNRSAARDVYRA